MNRRLAKILEVENSREEKPGTSTLILSAGDGRKSRHNT